MNILPNSDIKKVNRIIRIMEMLSRNIPVSTRKLAEEFNVSQRTIQRDLQTIKSEFGEGFIKKNFSNKKESSVSLDSIFLRLIKNLSREWYDEIKRMYDIVEDIKTSTIIPIMPKRRNEKKNNVDIIQKIDNAIEFLNKIEFYYDRGDGKIKKVVACPLKILYYDGFLYLLCFLDKSGNEISYRTYRIDRIKELNETDETFMYTENLEELLENIYSVWGIRDKTGGKTYNVNLEIYSWAVDFFENFNVLRDQSTIRKKDKIIVKGKVFNFNEIIPYILRFMPYVKVKSPKSLKKEIDKIISEYKKL